ncbi:hypothetical protein EC08BKT55439_5027 [Escherichia coli 08BKT055439]|nr:hypothetical protein ECDEC4C_5033 [Escherichia coli DEC4C]EHW05221.1 hypothetical protein ECDEC8B_5156 [Escherichia coli DEC8B]EHW62631.1 hypothetical protein ECDEC10A_2698 [Escherichia coli DEC10A]EIN47752.1 hypothetical protein EC93001_5808 [Escherichia coli 93-001]EIO29652.1 hypothetical protein ECPA41_5718 [Escherichia coli PA41]EKH31081.1 hypothetical protein ECFRIK1997_6231 [Escherichia coli FRIK1997]EKH42289.1 hypothetical protein ECFRIK1999_0505 [Escherichia coli FRIK1999]EKH67562
MSYNLTFDIDYIIRYRVKTSKRLITTPSGVFLFSFMG